MNIPPKPPGPSFSSTSKKQEHKSAKDSTKPGPLEPSQTSGKSISERKTVTNNTTSSIQPEDLSPEKLLSDFQSSRLRKESLEHQVCLAREAGNISQILRHQNLGAAPPHIIVIHIGGSGDMTNVIPPDLSMQNTKKSAALCNTLADTFALIDKHFTEDQKSQLTADLNSAKENLSNIEAKLAEHNIPLPGRPKPEMRSALALDLLNKLRPQIRPDSIPVAPGSERQKPLTYFSDQRVHESPEPLKKPPRAEDPVTPSPLVSHSSAPAKSKKTRGKRVRQKDRQPSQQSKESPVKTPEPQNKQIKLTEAYKAGRVKIQTVNINPYATTEAQEPTDNLIGRATLARIGNSPLDTHGLPNPLSKIPDIDPRIDTTGKQAYAHSARKALLFPILMNSMKAWQHPEALCYSDQVIPLYQLGLAAATPNTRGVLEKTGSAEQQKLITDMLINLGDIDSEISTTIATDISGTNDIFEHAGNSPIAAKLVRDIERLERMRFITSLNIEDLESFKLIKHQLEQTNQWPSNEQAVKRHFSDLCAGWLCGLQEQGEIEVGCSIKFNNEVIVNIPPKVALNTASKDSLHSVYTTQKNIMLKQPALAYFSQLSTLPD
ncbi:hypothetical protein EOPP23_00950 [Endozoicomonas sp. OPT23]|uniref:hypothetical protein n=1 Tax=Endozoicomonas sp. OPT23 TaxID=2072845 RepID=UPI00129B26DA|nr:hypothetical protein [Endozoicomonas sp. OPT23]MRI31559.1 hypothetical protein [Endozoicomonas sp. OPT23]